MTFLPLNLITQFKKLANVYFLLISCLQTIEMISITDGTPVQAGPLLLVVIISMVKDAFEDHKRAKSDNEENDSEALVYDGSAKSFQRT